MYRTTQGKAVLDKILQEPSPADLKIAKLKKFIEDEQAIRNTRGLSINALIIKAHKEILSLGIEQEYSEDADYKTLTI